MVKQLALAKRSSRLLLVRSNAKCLTGVLLLSRLSLHDGPFLVMKLKVALIVIGGTGVIALISRLLLLADDLSAFL